MAMTKKEINGKLIGICASMKSQADKIVDEKIAIRKRMVERSNSFEIIDILIGEIHRLEDLKSALVYEKPYNPETLCYMSQFMMAVKRIEEF